MLLSLKPTDAKNFNYSTLSKAFQVKLFKDLFGGEAKLFRWVCGDNWNDPEVFRDANLLYVKYQSLKRKFLEFQHISSNKMQNVNQNI